MLHPRGACAQAGYRNLVQHKFVHPTVAEFSVGQRIIHHHFLDGNRPVVGSVKFEPEETTKFSPTSKKAQLTKYRW